MLKASTSRVRQLRTQRTLNSDVDGGRKSQSATTNELSDNIGDRQGGGYCDRQVISKSGVY